jgi:starch phosphorylase
MGRTLTNNLINLGLTPVIKEALSKLGLNLEELEEQEEDAGLGNGGLGRLAACFVDSMATLALPAYGYGIRYDYGIFTQKIINKEQVEVPDMWLEGGNPWEVVRKDEKRRVKFGGRVEIYEDMVFKWVDTEDVYAVPYDTAVIGYKNDTVNTLRLWSATAVHEFDLEAFNWGDYSRANEEAVKAATITKVLYPNDNHYQGKVLRLKQQYFLVSATLQDVIANFKASTPPGQAIDFHSLPSKVAIQLNDTHPSLAVPELMYQLMDLENLGWEEAWEITVKTCSYTNHTVLPEALEKWEFELLEHLLPRHLQIIVEIDRRLMEQVELLWPEDEEKHERMRIVQETPFKAIRMANLAVVGGHAVNGVAYMHSELIKTTIFKDFYALWPKKFQNKTNGITPRRWLALCNPELSSLITETIGDGWLRDLSELRFLKLYAENSTFCSKFAAIKHNNKVKLASYLKETLGVEVDPHSLFDCQVKRIHEYKRQLLNILHIISIYNRIKINPSIEVVKRTFFLGGKAAPGYYAAKQIIKLYNSVAEVVNNDKDVAGRIKVVYLENYRVSFAEKVIPAIDLSQQISLAGMEASGTGNMKFMLNGALTIGTLDGANVEMREECGPENFFLFGMTEPEVANLRATGYDPKKFINSNMELNFAIYSIKHGVFSGGDTTVFESIAEGLINYDYFCLCADFADYQRAQEKVEKVYVNQAKWVKACVINTASAGKFSSDRTISQYAQDIWDVESCPMSIVTAKRVFMHNHAAEPQLTVERRHSLCMEKPSVHPASHSTDTLFPKKANNFIAAHD